MRKLGGEFFGKEVENGHFFWAGFNAKAQRGRGAKRTYFNHGGARILTAKTQREKFICRIRLRSELRRDKEVKTEGNEDGTVAGSAVGATSL